MQTSSKGREQKFLGSDEKEKNVRKKPLGKNYYAKR